MGGAASSTKAKRETLDPETTGLGVKATGTLIYYNQNDKEAEAKPNIKPIDEQTFFGLDVDYEDIDIHETIGQGTYGKVYKAHYQDQQIAVKKIFLSVVPDERAEIMEDFAKEIKILSILKHECIIQFLGACRGDPNYCLLFELCEGSVASLLNMVRKHRVNVTWRMCLKIALDCARACAYLHELTPKVLHRDLSTLPPFLLLLLCCLVSCLLDSDEQSRDSLQFNQPLIDSYQPQRPRTSCWTTSSTAS